MISAFTSSNLHVEIAFLKFQLRFFENGDDITFFHDVIAWLDPHWFRQCPPILV
jgi:hypothetical protein